MHRFTPIKHFMGNSTKYSPLRTRAEGAVMRRLSFAVPVRG